MIGHVLAGLALTAAPPAGSAFDLVCSGTSRFVSKSRPPVASVTPIRMRIRIDLASRRVCIERCKLAEPIIAISPSRMTLVSVHLRAGEARRDAEAILYRLSGVLEIHNFDTDAGVGEARLPCKREAFSGFPR